MNKIVKIAITGGQLAGKDRIIQKLKQDLENKGYYVVCTNEIAEYIMRHNIKPFGEEKIETLKFQDAVFKKQIFEEDLYMNLMQNISTTKTIVFLVNRGLLDGKAFLRDEEFEEILNINNFDLKDIKNRYDIVLCLETMAKLGVYNQHENNEVRFQNMQEAIEMNDKFYENYKTYFNDKLKYFEAEPDFDVKYNKILDYLLTKFN